MRETITGTLHVLRSIKYPRTKYLFDDLVVSGVLSAKHDTGTLPAKYYYPPMYYMTNDHMYSDDRHFIYKFKGRPKKLEEAKEGDIVTVRATIEKWRNGIGAYLIRPEIISVEASNELV